MPTEPANKKKKVVKKKKADWEMVADNGRKYKKEIHCPMVIETIMRTGRISSFCKVAMVSDTSFYRWCSDHREFRECYRYAKALAEEVWALEGDMNHGDPEWNYDYWKHRGSLWFNHGKPNKIRLDIDPKAYPKIVTGKP